MVIETALVEVFNQGADRLIEQRRPMLHRVEEMMIDGMVVPALRASAHGAVERDRDQFNSRFDQPPREQTLLPPAIPAVAVAYSRIFTRNVERPPRGRPVEHVPGLGLEFVESFHISTSVDFPPHPVEAHPQANSLFESRGPFA